jgi:hypothetical protein
VVTVIVVVVPAGTVPSPCFNKKPCIAALVDFLPEIDCESVVEVGLN